MSRFPGVGLILPLPVAAIQRVLDVVSVEEVWGSEAVGVGGEEVGGGEAERARERHAGLLQDATGGEILCVGGGDHALHARFRETGADQSAGTFGGVASAPLGPAQAVAERDDTGGGFQDNLPRSLLPTGSLPIFLRLGRCFLRPEPFII